MITRQKLIHVPWGEHPLTEGNLETLMRIARLTRYTHQEQPGRNFHRSFIEEEFYEAHTFGILRRRDMVAFYRSLGLPVSRVEGAQMNRYDVGAYMDGHTDRGPQEFTAAIHLEPALEGGVFFIGDDNCQRRIKPKQGDLLVWRA